MNEPLFGWVLMVLYIAQDRMGSLQLADPEFGSHGQIDLLLGVDVFVIILLICQRYGKVRRQPLKPTWVGSLLVQLMEV